MACGFPASKGYYQIRLQAKKNTTAATHTYSGRLPKGVSTVRVADLKLGFALNLVVMKAVRNHPLRGAPRQGKLVGPLQASQLLRRGTLGSMGKVEMAEPPGRHMDMDMDMGRCPMRGQAALAIS